MADLNKIYLYRMTHIDNVDHILQNGITHKNAINANKNFTPIGDSSLISTRNSFVLNNGKTIGDYIPFYFGTRTPMLYVIQKGFNSVVATPAEKIIYCVTSIQKIIDQNLNFVFTDGHAVDLFSSQYLPNDVLNIDSLLDWDAIKTMDWNNATDLDMKRRKQAEFLIAEDIPFTLILGFYVYNQTAKDILLSKGVLDKQIRINKPFYF